MTHPSKETAILSVPGKRLVEQRLPMLMRLKERASDGRKTWKLPLMDLKSYSRWYDYSCARDDMFAARSDDRKSARLNIIKHLLNAIPYQDIPGEKVVLPKRQKPGDYVDPNYPVKLVPEIH